MTPKHLRLLGWISLFLILILGLLLIYGCALGSKGIDLSRPTMTQTPVTVKAGGDATVVTLGRLGGGGLCCSLLIASLFFGWRNHTATKALDRTMTAIEKYDGEKGDYQARAIKHWVRQEGLITSGHRSGRINAPEHLIRRRLARMKM